VSGGTVAYLGPPGTFSEEALLASAPGPVEAVPCATVHEVVLAVQDGSTDLAIVPIESASEGSVDPTLDALAGSAPEVEIVAEAVLPVRHALLAAPGVGVDEVEVVVSHPQALAQCAAFLRGSLPAARAVAWTSTAEAVRAAVEHAADRWAAIGTLRAAELYGAEVLREGIEDAADNATRFVWLARDGRPAFAPSRDAMKTSLLFAGAGAGQAGWLVRCLSEFAFRGVNLTRIESRPRRDRLGDYVFFVDLEGAAADESVRAAIDGLRAHCDSVRVLGSYAAA
jgi:prephenate dehydratase